MKRFVLIGLAILVIASLTAPVFAWEFSMKGETEYRYRYWTRTGNNDIFGSMGGTVDLGINQLQTFPTATSQTTRASGTFGVLAGENRFGSDMQLTDYRMTLYPTIKVNQAIEVTASVNLTSLGIWSAGQPLVSNGGAFVPGPAAPGTLPVGFVNSLYVPDQDEAIGTDVPATYITLQWLKTAIRTPMLDFSIGYKATKLGMGLWKHDFNRPSGSFDISATYGPFKFGFAPYFGRNQSTWGLGTNGNGPPWSRNEGAGASQRQTDRRNYFKALEGYIEYSNGPFYFVIASDSYVQPSAPIPDKRGAFPLNSAAVPDADVIRYRPTVAMKYFNGRFFFNAEADWFTRWRSGRGTGQDTLLVSVGQDNSAWLYGLETGFICGPAKLTFNYVRATGDDPSTRHTTEDAASSEAGLNAGYMKEWGYLMYYMYGAGDGWDAAGYGQPTNFQHLGGRLDYAVASNLNIFTRYAYAWRDQPNAYRLGGNYGLGALAWTNEDIRLSQLGAFRGHAVPDSAREIGWEVDLGINWKLLESLTWDTTLAYWKPGSWWAYAYPNTAELYRLGINPVTNAANNNAAAEAAATQQLGRDIDAFFCVESRLLITF